MPLTLTSTAYSGRLEFLAEGNDERGFRLAWTDECGVSGGLSGLTRGQAEDALCSLAAALQDATTVAEERLERITAPLVGRRMAECHGALETLPAAGPALLTCTHRNVEGGICCTCGAEMPPF